jgi:hypothetical protein
MESCSHMLRRILALALTISLMGCATQTTSSQVSPSQFMEKLPGTTEARYLDRSATPDLLLLGVCTVRGADRRYRSPIGVTMPELLQRGARGIDDGVVEDGGNAYVIKNLEWVQIEGSPAQLDVGFDTLNCLTPKVISPIRPVQASA